VPLPARPLSSSLPAPASPEPARTLHRGLSLRPRDAVDPYALKRFAPDTVGISQVSVWCPHCNGSLLVVEMHMTEQGLYIEAVCYSCSNPHRDRPGIYKRLRIPLAWGKLPDIEE